MLDGVFSLAVLEHIAAPWVLAAEINKVLKIGGLTFHVLPETFPVHEMPNDFWRMTDEALKVLFCPGLGFEVLDAGMAHPMQILPPPSLRRGARLPHAEIPRLQHVLCHRQKNSGDFRGGGHLADATGRDEQAKSRLPVPQREARQS